MYLLCTFPGPLCVLTLHDYDRRQCCPGAEVLRVYRTEARRQQRLVLHHGQGQGDRAEICQRPDLLS